MAAITQVDTNEAREFGTGALVAVEQVTVDVTLPANEYSLHVKARAALTANATYLALPSPTNAPTAAQVKALTRQVNALARLIIGADLLADTTGT